MLCSFLLSPIEKEKIKKMIKVIWAHGQVHHSGPIYWNACRKRKIINIIPVVIGLWQYLFISNTIHHGELHDCQG
jgi:hypothetical protein